MPSPLSSDVAAPARQASEVEWTKCPACDAVLYSTDLEKNLNVCPKCGFHQRIGARARLDALLDADGRFEIGAEVLPVDSLKFRDSKKYTERLLEAEAESGGRLVHVAATIAGAPHTYLLLVQLTGAPDDAATLDGVLSSFSPMPTSATRSTCSETLYSRPGTA